MLPLGAAGDEVGKEKGQGTRTAGVFGLVEDVVQVFLVASEGGREAERGETRAGSGEGAKDEHEEGEGVIT